ncbi:LAFE_0G16710g1_1 [Lachancea fermentati]|uniref:LAFE_0G16710g1_1 n=1 Tax=Lachancea fermentati TaxID=4955 RepID=A0A1G4MIL5_LACFM|nr:LAFE_0G16710g1_1 [Lachancea fermentati]
MEQEIRELEHQHVELYRELLKALDRLYLLRKGIKPLDESLLAIRHQLQTSLAMTVPTIKTITDANNPNDLEKRLLEMMQENYELDQEVVSLQDKNLQLVKEFSLLRANYKRMRPEIRELVETIRLRSLEAQSPSSSQPAQNISSEEEDALRQENEKLTEIIGALIIHSGYQGTDSVINKWLEYL